jgi:alcohol dehydrogenase class IV
MSAANLKVDAGPGADEPIRLLVGEADIPAGTRIVYGPDKAFDTIQHEVALAGGSRAFLVTGRSLGASDLVARLKAALGERCVGHFAGMGEHSPRSTVVAAAREATAAGADVLIGIGGGSSIVGTKGVALVMGEGEDLDALRAVYDYQTRKITVPPLLKAKPAIIAIPTTLSAGEFSSAMGITSDEGAKDIFIDPKVVPRTIILDPVMTTATPPRLWASTGIKGLHNAVERYYARNVNPFMEGLCLEAIRNVFRYLPLSIERPDDLGARGHLQFLNWMTAFGAGKGGIGLGHGICHQLGGLCDVPHGISGCIVLPHMMVFNRPATLERQREMAAAMGLPVDEMTLEDAAIAAAEKVRGLIASLGLPQRLRDVGVSHDALPKVAELTLRDRTLSPTPRPPRDAEEILQLLEEMY